MITASRILGDEVGSTAPAFLAILAIHVVAGLAAVITGAIAALTRKGSPRHIRAGRWYYRAITAVFATAAGLAAMRWAKDYYLLILGAVAFTAATIGYLHRRRHRPGDTGHIAGMGIAYTAMLTAFYVDNGSHLPLWDRLPTPTFWLLPSAIAAPLITRAIIRAGSKGPAGTTGGSGGRGQPRCEPLDAVAEVGYRRVETGGIADRDRVGDGPVHGCLAAEFFAGHVADRDHKIVHLPDIGDVAGPQPGQRQAVAPGGGDRARVDRRPGMGAGRYCRDAAGPAPQRGGQVRARRVGGAHEQHPPRRAGWRRSQRAQGAGGAWDKPQVGTAAIALGPAAADDSGLLQHVQVVRQQVGRHGQHGRQLGRGRVPR